MKALGEIMEPVWGAFSRAHGAYLEGRSNGYAPCPSLATTGDGPAKCSQCGDTGIILLEENDGRVDRGMPCPCMGAKIPRGLVEVFGNKTFVAASVGKTLDNYKADNDYTKAALAAATRFVNEMRQPRSPEPRHRSMVLTGQSGAGKTHLLCAIGNALREAGIACLYLPYVEAMGQFKAWVRQDDNPFEVKMAQIRKAPVLLWDDLWKGRARPTDWEVAVTYDIINARYESHLPTVVSSEWHLANIIDEDEAIGTRVLEMGGARIIEFPRDPSLNYRLRQGGAA